MQLSDNIGTKEDVAFYRLQVAKEDLETAQLLLRENKYRAANNRAYYAIYHAIDTVLSLEGQSFKRHKDTIYCHWNFSKRIRQKNNHKKQRNKHEQKSSEY